MRVDIQENKMKLAQYIEKEYKVTVDPTSLFDMQVMKCIHAFTSSTEYDYATCLLLVGHVSASIY